MNITILNYNIWFDTTTRSHRIKALINIIKLYNPDVICLQEVTQYTYDILYESFCNSYNMFPNKIENYDCLILSKFKIIEYHNQKFNNTSMDRKLHHIVIEHNNTNIIIATTHFESEFKYKNFNKIDQYHEAQYLLNKLTKLTPYVIFCSDTNILSHEECDFFKNDKKWLDSWSTCGSDKNIEYTYDTINNTNLKFKCSDKTIQSRIDRIIYHNHNLIPSDYRLIKKIDNIEPSDHYGIFLNFYVY